MIGITVIITVDAGIGGLVADFQRGIGVVGQRNPAEIVPPAVVGSADQQHITPAAQHHLSHGGHRPGLAGFAVVHAVMGQIGNGFICRMIKQLMVVEHANKVVTHSVVSLQGRRYYPTYRNTAAGFLVNHQITHNAQIQPRIIFLPALLPGFVQRDLPVILSVVIAQGIGIGVHQNQLIGSIVSGNRLPGQHGVVFQIIDHQLRSAVAVKAAQCDNTALQRYNAVYTASIRDGFGQGDLRHSACRRLHLRLCKRFGRCRNFGCLRHFGLRRGFRGFGSLRRLRCLGLRLRFRRLRSLGLLLHRRCILYRRIDIFVAATGQKQG